MIQFIEMLPDTKSAKHWRILWSATESDYSPVCGSLTIVSNRSRAEYVVSEFPTGWAGRGFHLAKVAESGDTEQEAYDVFIGSEQDRRCDCAGFSYGRGRPCKHLEALAVLVRNGAI